MLLWKDLSTIAKIIALTNEDDQILWSFNSKGQYSVRSLYAIINHMSIVPIYIQAVWKLNIPPRVQIFLWLLCNNRLLTHDNLAKEEEVIDPTCSEKESVIRLFFDCCVAKCVWDFFSQLLNVNVGKNFESVASLWIANKKHLCANIVSSAVL